MNSAHALTALVSGTVLLSLTGCLTGEDKGKAESRAPYLLLSEAYVQDGNAFVLSGTGIKTERYCDRQRLDSLEYRIYDERTEYVLKADSLLFRPSVIYGNGPAGMELTQAYVRMGKGQGLEGLWGYVGDYYRAVAGEAPTADQIAYYDSVAARTREEADRFPRQVEFKAGRYSVYSSKSPADSLIEDLSNQAGFDWVIWFDTSYYSISFHKVSANVVEISGKDTGSQRIRMTLNAARDIEFSSNDAAIPKGVLYASPLSCPNELPEFVKDFMNANQGQ